MRWITVLDFQLDQTDSDEDGTGDACDHDDGDRFRRRRVADADNRPDVANPGRQ